MSVRDPLTLRPLTNDDTDLLSEWYYEDRDGLEEVFGARMPTERAFIKKCNELFQLMQRFSARMLMADLRSETIGFVLVTDVAQSLDMARAHIYLRPSKRRYALRIAEAGVTEATTMGIKTLVQTVKSDNASAIKLSKRVGFLPSPTVILTKELR